MNSVPLPLIGFNDSYALSRTSDCSSDQQVHLRQVIEKSASDILKMNKQLIYKSKLHKGTPKGIIRINVTV